MPVNHAQNALVLAPHPDDESLGCGGTLKLISSSGGQVDVLYMTSGESGSFPGEQTTPEARAALARKRREEAADACRVLGVRDVAFLNGKDGALGSQPELSDRILGALRGREYRSVFCPWPNDGHVDHKATYAMLHQSLSRYGREIDVWLYEVWTPLPANIFVAIDGTIEAKLHAFNAHRSQAKVLDYASAFDGLARYRGLFCPPARHAEAFFNCDSGALLRHQDIPWPKSDGLARA